MFSEKILAEKKNNLFFVPVSLNIHDLNFKKKKNKTRAIC